MLRKLFQVVWAVPLVPVGIGYSVAFYEALLSLRQVRGPELAVLLGATAYLAFHAVIGQPERAYVLGHELAHAAALWITGRPVKGFKAGKHSGSVKTDKVSGVTALAPYLVPTYAILWVLLYGAAGLFWNLSAFTQWFFFGIGFALAFHLVFTVNVLKEKQSDLDVWGPVVSLGIIYWVNLALMVGVMGLVIPEVRWLEYLASGFRHTVTFWALLVHWLFVR